MKETSWSEASLSVMTGLKRMGVVQKLHKFFAGWYAELHIFNHANFQSYISHNHVLLSTDQKTGVFSLSLHDIFCPIFKFLIYQGCLVTLADNLQESPNLAKSPNTLGWTMWGVRATKLPYLTAPTKPQIIVVRMKEWGWSVQVAQVGLSWDFRIYLNEYHWKRVLT